MRQGLPHKNHLFKKKRLMDFMHQLFKNKINVSIAVYACVYVHLIMTQLHKTTHQLIHMQPGAILQL